MRSLIRVFNRLYSHLSQLEAGHALLIAIRVLQTVCFRRDPPRHGVVDGAAVFLLAAESVDEGTLEAGRPKAARRAIEVLLQRY